MKDLGIDLHYDLYAMINHYGSLHFGHYTSIVKNLQENKWYLYDDSTRTPIEEDKIQKEYAYILFYIRRDVAQGSKTLDDIFPNIREDLFPGKPINTDRGEAFVIDREVNGNFKVQYLKGKETEVVR